MRTITYTIARGLYCLENHIPRLKPFLQKIASFVSSSVARDLADLRQWSLLCSSTRTGSVPGRMNCWEFTGCRKETHGRYANVLGVCPAALESRLDGIHGGRNGGRACWVVPGTHCHGNIRKSFEQKIETCSQCGFYQAVKWEESVSFIQSGDLLLKLLR
jgi:hypothetical protein